MGTTAVLKMVGIVLIGLSVPFALIVLACKEAKKARGSVAKYRDR